jgi:hypothetical protein
MDGQVVDSAQVTVVVTDYLVVLKIPTFNLSVFTTGKQIWLAR